MMANLWTGRKNYITAYWNILSWEWTDDVLHRNDKAERAGVRAIVK